MYSPVSVRERGKGARQRKGESAYRMCININDAVEPAFAWERKTTEGREREKGRANRERGRGYRRGRGRGRERPGVRDRMSTWWGLKRKQMCVAPNVCISHTLHTHSHTHSHSVCGCNLPSVVARSYLHSK